MSLSESSSDEECAWYECPYGGDTCVELTWASGVFCSMCSGPAWCAVCEDESRAFSKCEKCRKVLGYCQ